jgi:TRAP-type C4-dicarboxylate transport system permease small subunit
VHALHQAAFAIARLGARIGGALLLLAAIIIGIDVVLRAFFARTIGGADELSGYALALSSAWGIAFALLHRAHIRIDSFYELCPRSLRAALDVLSLLGFIAFIGLTTWHAWGVLAQSIASDARSISALSTPLVLPQAIWVAGFIFVTVVAGLLLVEAALAWSRGDLRGVFGLIGSKAVSEEVQQEKVEQLVAASARQVES